MDLISREALIDLFVNLKDEHETNAISYNALCEVILKQPTIDAVPKPYVEQIRRERDIAIEQLNEIGCQLGQKMDEIKEKLNAVPVVHGNYTLAFSEEENVWKCSNCGDLWLLNDGTPFDNKMNFCPKCGARMDGKKNEEVPVIVVRCKDCKHYNAGTGWCKIHSHFIDYDGKACHPWESNDWKMFMDDDFCSDGERKEGAG